MTRQEQEDKRRLVAVLEALVESQGLSPVLCALHLAILRVLRARYESTGTVAEVRALTKVGAILGTATVEAKRGKL